MKMLILTQAVDINDPILGFFHNWIKEFAKHNEKLVVICLREGEHDLPENVRVLSLGKEDGESRLKYIFRFYKYIFSERKEYDSVYVHMNQEYVLLGGIFWRGLGKRIGLWYNHTYGSWKTRLSIKIVDVVFHTSPFAFTAGYKKSVRMPAGIDTEMFSPDNTVVKKKNSILFVGRLDPIKNVDILIDACVLLDQRKVPFTLNLYGSINKSHVKYIEALREKARTLSPSGKVYFNGSIPNYKLPNIYREHQVVVNLTPDGNYDKTVLEAMSCESISIASSSAFKEVLGDMLTFEKRDAGSLAKTLERVFLLTTEEYKKESSRLRLFVVKMHSLESLGSAVKKYLSKNAK